MEPALLGSAEDTQLYLAPQHEDGVDVGQDAVEAEVDVRTDQRKHRGQDAGARLELRSEGALAYVSLPTSTPTAPPRKSKERLAVWASTCGRTR